MSEQPRRYPGSLAPPAPNTVGHTIPESALLWTLRGMEALGLGGRSVSLFNDVVQRGRTAPITQNDFDTPDIEALRRVVMEKVAATGSRAGGVDYRDYNRVPPSARPNSDILGGFQYAVDPDGSVSITDSYDFNTTNRRTGAPLAGAHDDNPFLQTIAGLLNPRNLAIHIGRKAIPDTSGGVPVNIAIPPPRED
jgi:hypothetical protein